jgi:hypothetical protein
MGSYIKEVSFQGLIILLTIVSLIFQCIAFFWEIRKNKQYPWMAFYCLFSVSFCLLVFFMPVINGNYTGFDTLRYNIAVFYLSLLNLGFIAALFSGTGENKKLRRITIGFITLFLCVSVFSGIAKFSGPGLKGYFTYYPEMVKRVDEVASREKLTYGVGNYWVSKVVTMFSHTGVRVYPVYENIIPYDHVTNQNWFYDDRAQFDFIILNRFDETLSYREKLGPPCSVLSKGEADIIRVRPFRFSKMDGMPYVIDSLDCQNKCKTKP